MPQNPGTLLEVCGLSIGFDSGKDQSRTVIDRLCFSLNRGEILGLVGESGSGKTSIALSLLRLIKPPGRITSGRVLFDAVDLLSLPAAEVRQYRGSKIAMVFQEPLAAMNPLLRVGTHLSEGMLCHFSCSRQAAWERGRELLREVGISEPERILESYPHQLSGGERQRVGIALALSCDPQVILADEPTSALDLRLQAQVLTLLRQIKTRRQLSILLISHDLSVISMMADRIAVLQSGRIVEIQPAEMLFAQPQHSYTRKLLSDAKLVGPICQY